MLGVVSGKNIYMYVDETGNLDFAPEGKSGASSYFGFGSAVFEGHHGDAIYDALRLRMKLGTDNVHLPRGFHATSDQNFVRNRVFSLIADHDFRFDSTFLLKENAYPYIKRAGQMRLYKMAWYLHFKEIARQVSNKDDRLWVVAGTFGTAARNREATAALQDVCNQLDRDIRLSVWSNETSWGLQCADYALWAVGRLAEGKACSWYESCVKPKVSSEFFPWGKTK